MIDVSSMYLLDTNVCIALMKLNPIVLAQFEPNQSECALPIIVVSELYKGAYYSRKVESNLAALQAFLLPFPVIDLDLDAAEDFGRIQSELKMIGRPTGAIDALIAAIARSHSATLVTHNTKDFENIPGLKLEDWLV